MNARFPLSVFRSPRAIIRRNRLIAAVVSQVIGTVIAALMQR